MKSRKKIRVLLLVSGLLLLFSFPVCAGESSLYDEQFEQSGAAGLRETLPEEARELWEKAEPEGKFDAGALGEALWNDAREQMTAPLKALGKILAACVICALAGAVKTDRMAEVEQTVGSLFIALTAALPVSSCILAASEMVRHAGGFILACAPVMAGILLAGGRPMSASAHSFLMLGAGDAVSLLASGFMVPVLQVFLMLSLVSALSPNIRLEGVCRAFYKALKWTLGFSMTVFSAVMGIQNLFSLQTDAVRLRAAKFAVSSFVPVVGGAISESLSAVEGALKALRSGVGAIGLLGIVLIVTPVMLRCLIWRLTCSCGEAAAALMGVESGKRLLEAVGKCLEAVMLILLCCMLLMAVSAAAVLAGGAA